MRKITYVLAVIALILTSCSHRSYTITGTMEESVDGDTVFIAEPGSNKLVFLDTAIVANGVFTFAGVQDSAVNRYLVYKGVDDLRPYHLNFFLENGQIKANMTRRNGVGVISGTAMNNAYQVFNENMNTVFAERRQVYDAPAQTEKEIADKMQAIKEVEAKMLSVMKEGIQSNLSSLLGVYLLDSFNYYMDYDELEELLVQVPANLQNHQVIVKLNNLITVSKNTAVGEKFVDFEMNDPQGNLVKLSDYAGKGKLVLVDFWASWCRPCREEMPALVEAYAKYKDKNFEIVGVSLDTQEDAWSKGIEQLNITWPQMSDLKRFESEGVKLYAIRSIPHVVLIDGEGTIVSRGLHGGELQEKLAELLEK